MDRDSLIGRAQRGVRDLVSERLPKAAKRGRDAVAPATGHVATEPASLAAAPEAVGWEPDASAFERDLDGALAANRDVAAGGLHFLDLDRLTERYGHRGSDLHDKALAVTGRIIERHLPPGAFYKQSSGGAFLLGLPGVPPDEARLKMAAIAEAVNDLLVGEAGEQLATVRGGAAAVDSGFLHQDDDARFAAMGLDTSERAPPKDREGSSLSDWLENLPPMPQPPQIDEMGFVYRPMWSVARQRVSTFICQPAATLKTGRLAMGDDLLDFWDAESQGWKLDIAGLRAAGRATHNALAAGSSASFVAPVHWQTLTNSLQRQRFLTTAWEFAPGVRRRLVLELTGLPPRLAPERFRDAVQSLAPICRTVICGASPGWRQMELLYGQNIHLVGFDARTAGLGEAKLQEVLPAFAAAARRNRLGCYVQGLTRPGSVAAALAAGFAFLDGDAVAPFARQPRNPYRLATGKLGGRGG